VNARRRRGRRCFLAAKLFEKMTWYQLYVDVKMQLGTSTIL
jgi:hypothetical protein